MRTHACMNIPKNSKNLWRGFYTYTKKAYPNATDAEIIDLWECRILSIWDAWTDPQRPKYQRPKPTLREETNRHPYQPPKTDNSPSVLDPAAQALECGS